LTGRLLIDQCVSRRMAAAIFAPLADITFVGDLAPGAIDEQVLDLARREDRILVTEDYDFGRMIFVEGRPPPPGLIHLALAGMTIGERMTKLAAEAARLIEAAPGRFVVFSKGALRSRALPPSA
jgi:predicted nuclease of predicted toxin-antitoxin system